MTGILNILAGSISSAIKDGYFNLVSLLLPGDSTNGAQNNTFLDSSSNNFTITRNGNTTQGTFSPFSQTGWANYFSATGDNLRTGTITAFGTGNFTLECWINPTAFANYNLIWDSRTSDADTAGFSFALDSSKKVNFYCGGFQITTATALTENTWYHVALVRNGTGTGNVKIYINGTADANTATNTNNFTRTAAYIGNDWDGTGAVFSGYISNLRATTGALYTSTFTPSTTPLTTTVSAGTCILLTCQSNRFLDNSASAVTITPTGSSVQSFSPFAPTAAYSATTNGGSGYFDANGDYLSISDASNLASPGSGDFQISAWVYLPQAISNALNISSFYHLKNDSGLSTTVFVAELSNTGSLSLSTGTALIASGSAGLVKVGQWNYIVISRVSGTLRTFINGTQDISVANSTAYNGSFVQVGAWRFSSADYSLNGYISGLRVVKGSGVTSVTVPTAPPTAITNTSLLLNFTNGGITDATAKNVLETVGNAQISTTQSKWGGASMYFDGTGDWLVARDNPLLNLGTGDFTVEFWVLRTSSWNGVAQSLLSKGGYNFSGANVGGWSVVWTSGNAIVFSIGSSGTDYQFTGSSTTFTANVWSHVAITRSGTSLRCFIDGTQLGTTLTTSNDGSTSSYGLLVGSTFNNGNTLTGYIDDLRISKFARYTGNFTPPTAAFALQ